MNIEYKAIFKTKSVITVFYSPLISNWLLNTFLNYTKFIYKDKQTIHRGHL